MKSKLLTIFLTIFLILVSVPMALAQDGEDGSANGYCADLSGRRHPVGERLADRYGVPYSDLMKWFCDDHFGFGEILLALQTSRVISTEETPDQLLQLKSELGGWGQVWKSFGYTGRPKADRPASGPPAWAGPNDTDEGDSEGGPPPWAGPKDKSGESGKGGPPPWAGPKHKIGPVVPDSP